MVSENLRVSVKAASFIAVGVCCGGLHTTADQEVQIWRLSLELPISLSVFITGATYIARWLRMLAVLAEGWSSEGETHIK